jgi:HAD superfamily hydrolase (TIGR01509 family)
MGFDLVIFDCDGVLIDSELLSVRADIACLAEDGIELSEDEILERYTGISMAGMLADLEQRHGRALPDFADRHHQRLSELFAAELCAIAGIEEVLDSLARRSCVASSGTPERLIMALGKVGLFDRFHPHIFSATMVKRGKPAPDLFLYAARQMAVAPERCVVIEDSLPGIAATIAAGMIPLGFTGGSHCRPDHAARLGGAGAAQVARNMPELQTILAGLSR